MMISVTGALGPDRITRTEEAAKLCQDAISKSLDLEIALLTFERQFSYDCVDLWIIKGDTILGELKHIYDQLAQRAWRCLNAETLSHERN